MTDHFIYNRERDLRCDCLDGAYQFCDVCSPPEKRMTWTQMEIMMEQATSEIAAWPQWMKIAYNVKPEQS